MIVVVVSGVATVVVDTVTPTQEQALEYRTEPEQGDAYAGMFDGTTVVWRGARPPLRLSSSPLPSTKVTVIVASIVSVVVMLVTTVTVESNREVAVTSRV